MNKIEDVITGFRWPVKTPEQLYDYLRDIQLDVNNSGCYSDDAEE
jgi:hypothetical protein